MEEEEDLLNSSEDAPIENDWEADCAWPQNEEWTKSFLATWCKGAAELRQAKVFNFEENPMVVWKREGGEAEGAPGTSSMI